MKIILIERNAAACALVKDALKGLGHEIRTAASEREAIAQVAAAPPDVFIIGLDVPQAATIIRNLRKQPVRHYQYILAVAAPTQQDLLNAAYEADCDGETRAPVQPTDLRARLQAAERLIRVAAVSGRTAPQGPQGGVAAPAPPKAGASLGVAALAVLRSPAWGGLREELRSTCGTLFGLDAVLGQAGGMAPDLSVAYGVVLANVEREIEIR